MVSWYPGASPSQKSVQRLKDKVRRAAGARQHGPWPVVRDQLHSFCGAGPRTSATVRVCRRYRAIDNHVYERVRHFLVRRHKVPGAARDGSPMRMSSANSASCTSDACTLGHRRVPHGEAGRKAGCRKFGPSGSRRGRETGRGHRAQATAPVLDSTGWRFKTARELSVHVAFPASRAVANFATINSSEVPLLLAFGRRYHLKPIEHHLNLRTGDSHTPESSSQPVEPALHIQSNR